MAPHQQRVVDEKTELDEKLQRLRDFFGGAIYPNLSEEERDRLNRQAGVMQQYSDILGERIAAF